MQSVLTWIFLLPKPGLYGPGVGMGFVALCGINTGVKNLISALDHELNRLGGGA